MGEYAEQNIENYISGRWGMRVEKPRMYPTTTKAAIADRPFHIVTVKAGGRHGQADEPSAWHQAGRLRQGRRRLLGVDHERRVRHCEIRPARTERRPFRPLDPRHKNVS